MTAMDQTTIGQDQPQTILRKIPPKAAFLKPNSLLPILVIVIVVAAGIFTGLVVSSRTKSSQIESKTKAAISEESLSGEQKKSFSQTFRDQAEGTVEKNSDLDKYAQGTHKLLRPGGESQTAYLTSSVLDLDDFIGKKVKVYGETFGSSKVGWLMDVGKVEIIN